MLAKLPAGPPRADLQGRGRPSNVAHPKRYACRGQSPSRGGPALPLQDVSNHDVTIKAATFMPSCMRVRRPRSRAMSS